MGTSEQTRGSRRWKELTIIKTIIGVAPGIIFLAFGLSAEAQQPRKLARVGYLSSAGPITRGYRIDAFRQGLKELGYIEGKNIIIEYRFAEANQIGYPSWRASLSV
jgi:putative ABC transport system substrate-binding protein